MLLSYSRAYTLVPTYECFNRCTYCNFRRDPETSPWLTPGEARDRLAGLDHPTITEILILSGEVHPRSPRRRAWLDHLVAIAQLAGEMGFFPHTNAGPLSFGEMAILGKVNVSLGLMLEQVTPSLGQTVHRHAPSKEPTLRLQQLHWAGELGIPFTTGLLLGIGETPEDWRETLRAIAQIQDRWGHIQEVILQPHRPGERQAWRGSGFDLAQLPRVVALARAWLPPEVAIQIPPNLLGSLDLLERCILAGARDLGGLVPKDEVNPDYHHWSEDHLVAWCGDRGWQLRPRLPVYPPWYPWLAAPWRERVQQWPYP